MEFSNIGKHCSLETCKLYDYLPFECNLCNKYYCLEHKSPESHGCVIKENIINTKKIKKKKKNPKCIKCKIRSQFNIKCIHCKQTTCLQHRYTDSHKCILAN